MNPVNLDPLFEKLPSYVINNKYSYCGDAFVLARTPLLQTDSLRCDFTLTEPVVTPAFLKPKFDKYSRPMNFIVEKVEDRFIMKVSSAIDIIRDIRCEIPHHVEINGSCIPGKKCMPATFGENRVVIVFDLDSDNIPETFPIEVECSFLNTDLWKLLTSTTKSVEFGGYTYTK